MKEMKMQEKGVWKSTKRKRCIYQSKNEVQEQFGRKMNEDVNGNMKWFWKELSNANRGKVENSKRIKDVNGRGHWKSVKGFEGIL